MPIPETTLLFLHIPKAAGTTLSRIAARHFPASTQYRLGANAQLGLQRFNDLPEKIRSRYRYLAGHFPYGAHEKVPGPSAYLTFLRDPVDRVISFYHFIRADPAHPLYNQLPDTLERFACGTRIPIFDNGQTRQLAGDWGRRPAGTCDPRLLERAKQNLDRIDVVGLSESFLPCLLLAADRFGWTRLGYRRENRNLSRPRTPLDPGLRRALEEMNRFDRDLYAYATQRVEHDISAAGSLLTERLQTFSRDHPVPGPLRRNLDRLRSHTPREWVRYSLRRLPSAPHQNFR